MALPPRSFTSDIEQKILHELRRKVEGKCTGRFGYTVLVRRLEAFGNALLNEDSGWAHFPVKYLALVFRPHKNEVLLAEVVALNETGLFAQAGPLTIYVSRYVRKKERTEFILSSWNSKRACFSLWHRMLFTIHTPILRVLSRNNTHIESRKIPLLPSRLPVSALQLMKL